MAKPRILVTSAAGKTGLPTVLKLRERDYPVRALVRRDDGRAQRLRDAGAEVRLVNQYAVADLREAMHGIDRAYHCAPTAPNALHFGSAFAVAAAEVRLEHVVLLGQWLAHAEHPSVYTREVWLSESLLRRASGATVTTINVGWFADNYFMVLEPAAQLGLFPMPLGDGDVEKNAPPSNEDIAAVAVAALLGPEDHAGRTYRPTGPALVSPNQIARTLARALRRPVRYQDVSERMFLKAITALRPPMYHEGTLTQLRVYAEEYRRGAFAVGGPTSVVRDLTGREPEDLDTITRRYVAARPEARRTPGNRIRALRNFAKIILQPVPDVAAIERRRDHVMLDDAAYCRDHDGWMASHGG